MHAGYGHHRLGVLLLVLGVVAVAALTSYLVVWASRRSRAVAAVPPAYTGADRALETARVRYAQGEIDRDTYLRISTDLTGASTAPPSTP